jgi:hypothetical protein
MPQPIRLAAGIIDGRDESKSVYWSSRAASLSASLNAPTKTLFST